MFVTAGTSGGTVCVTASNSCATSTSSCTTVTVSSALSTPGAITGNTAICAGQGGLTYSVGSVSGASTYTWTLPAGWSFNSGQGTTNINVNAGSAGGDICVVASNSCSTSGSSCQTITVQSALPQPGIISGNVTVCSGQSGLNYSVGAVSGATSYNWTVPSGWIIVSGQGTNFINVAAGSVSGNVCVTAINSCSTSSASCSAVTVETTPSAPTGVTGDNIICAGDQNQLFIANPVAGATSYIWTLASGWNVVSGQGNDSVYVNASSVSGNVSVIASNTCGSSSAYNYPVIVNALPTQPTITPSGNDLVSSSATNNQWYLGGSLIPGATSQVYTPTVTGWYTVMVTDGNGCTNTSAAAYFVVTGIEQASYNGSTVYPNPTSDQLFVEGINNSDALTFRIYNMLGEQVLSTHNLSQIGNFTMKLDVSTLAPGSYVLRISSASEAPVMKQFVIQR